MRKLSSDIKGTSTWITTTPTPVSQRFPFYITEAGHFKTYSDYSVTRSIHDSFLLLYTCSGEGSVTTGETTFSLPEESVVIIDCHIPHEYSSSSDNWEFLWIHFNGVGVYGIFDVLYPDKIVKPAHIPTPREFKDNFTKLTQIMQNNDIESSVTVSASLHNFMNMVCSATLERDEENIKKDSSSDIKSVIAFIEDNYSKPITIDDMVDIIHISKYHFIRRFKRTMGITPYHYLTNHRITVAKKMLRTTNRTVTEIAELCGFLDTSNFISQFKKQTGQKPLGYRNDFS